MGKEQIFLIMDNRKLKTAPSDMVDESWEEDHVKQTLGLAIDYQAET